MRLWIQMTLAAVCASAGLGLAATCVPSGECVTVSATLPDLGSPGFPVGARWAGQSGSIFDSDTWSPDDWLGLAEMSNGTIFAELCNHGGNMVGPNGAVVDSGGKDSCAEVYFAARYNFTVQTKVCTSVGLSSGPGGGPSIGCSRCMTANFHATATWESPVQEICPC